MGATGVGDVGPARFLFRAGSALHVDLIRIPWTEKPVSSARERSRWTELRVLDARMALWRPRVAAAPASSGYEEQRRLDELCGVPDVRGERHRGNVPSLWRQRRARLRGSVGLRLVSQGGRRAVEVDSNGGTAVLDGRRDGSHRVPGLRRWVLL